MLCDGVTLPDDLAAELQRAPAEARELVLRLISEEYLTVREDDDEDWLSRLWERPVAGE